MTESRDGKEDNGQMASSKHKQSSANRFIKQTPNPSTFTSAKEFVDVMSTEKATGTDYETEGRGGKAASMKSTPTLPRAPLSLVLDDVNSNNAFFL
jgi:hypothetical protein